MSHSDLDLAPRRLRQLLEAVAVQHNRFEERKATGALAVEFHYYRGEVRAAKVFGLAVSIEIPLSDREGP